MNEHRVSWPMRAALVATAVIWGCGCWWSFTEQTAFAKSLGFEDPELLPVVIDGFAAAVAMVAFAASLDGRPAVGARLGTLLAVAGSGASNATWAFTRSGEDQVTVAVAISVPLVSGIAFEVILGEIRKQVERKRGLKPPVQIPYPRVIRLVLNPLTFFPWRRLVLELTDPAREVAPGQSVAVPGMWHTHPMQRLVRFPVRSRTGHRGGHSTGQVAASEPAIRPDTRPAIEADMDRTGDRTETGQPAGHGTGHESGHPTGQEPDTTPDTEPDTEPAKQADTRPDTTPDRNRTSNRSGKPDIAAAIVRLRDRDPDITQAAMAKRLKVSERTIRRYEATVSREPAVPPDALMLSVNGHNHQV